MESQFLAVLKVSSTRGGCSKTVCGLTRPRASGQLSTSILSTLSRVSSGAPLMPQWQHSRPSLRPGLGGAATTSRTSICPAATRTELDVELNKAILMVRCSAESSLRTSCIPLLKRWPDGKASVRQGVYVDLFLECLDAEAEKVGATRGDGPDVKSHVRLVGHPDALPAFVDQSWVTERVSRTCQVDAPNADCDVLGAVAGSAPAANLKFCERVAKLHELHSPLAEVNDPATELTLGRACADVCRSVHLLRTAGHDVSEDALKEHDEGLNSFVSRALGGDLRSVSQGGLGFRRAVGLAIPALTSSTSSLRWSLLGWRCLAPSCIMTGRPMPLGRSSKRRCRAIGLRWPLNVLVVPVMLPLNSSQPCSVVNVIVPLVRRLVWARPPIWSSRNSVPTTRNTLLQRAPSGRVCNEV